MIDRLLPRIKSAWRDLPHHLRRTLVWTGQLLTLMLGTVAAISRYQESDFRKAFTWFMLALLTIHLLYGAWQVLKWILWQLIVAHLKILLKKD